MYACAGHGDTVSGRKRQNGGVECAKQRLVVSNPCSINATFSRHSSGLYSNITCMCLQIRPAMDFVGYRFYSSDKEGGS